MKQEVYILRIMVDGMVTETAKTTSKENFEKLIADNKKAMNEQTYARVGFSKVRIDKKKITTVTIRYSRK